VNSLVRVKVRADFEAWSGLLAKVYTGITHLYLLAGPDAVVFPDEELPSPVAVSIC